MATQQFRLTDNTDGFTVVVSGDMAPDEQTIAQIIAEQRAIYKRNTQGKLNALAKVKEEEATKAENAPGFLRGALEQAFAPISNALDRSVNESIAPPPDTGMRGLPGRAIDWGSQQGQAMGNTLSAALDTAARGDRLGGARGLGAAASEGVGSIFGGLTDITPGIVHAGVEEAVPGANLRDPALEQVRVGKGLRTSEKVATLIPGFAAGGKAFNIVAALGMGGQAAAILTGMGLVPSQIQQAFQAYDEYKVASELAKVQGGDDELAYAKLLNAIEAIGMAGVGVYGAGRGVHEATKSAPPPKPTTKGEPKQLTQGRTYGSRAYGREGKVINEFDPSPIEGGQRFYVPPPGEGLPIQDPRRQPQPKPVEERRVVVKPEDVIAPPPKAREHPTVTPDEIITGEGDIIREGQVVGRTFEPVFDRSKQNREQRQLPAGPERKLLPEASPERIAIDKEKARLRQREEAKLTRAQIQAKAREELAREQPPAAEPTKEGEAKPLSDYALRKQIAALQTLTKEAHYSKDKGLMARTRLKMSEIRAELEKRNKAEGWRVLEENPRPGTKPQQPTLEKLTEPPKTDSTSIFKVEDPNDYVPVGKDKFGNPIYPGQEHLSPEERGARLVVAQIRGDEVVDRITKKSNHEAVRKGIERAGGREEVAEWIAELKRAKDKGGDEFAGQVSRGEKLIPDEPSAPTPTTPRPTIERPAPIKPKVPTDYPLKSDKALTKDIDDALSARQAAERSGNTELASEWGARVKRLQKQQETAPKAPPITLSDRDLAKRISELERTQKDLPNDAERALAHQEELTSLRQEQGKREALVPPPEPPPGKGRYREELTARQAEHAKLIAQDIIDNHKFVTTPRAIQKLAAEKATEQFGYKREIAGGRTERIAKAIAEQVLKADRLAVAQVVDLVRIPLTEPLPAVEQGAKAGSMARAAENLAAGKPGTVEITLTERGPIITDGRHALAAAKTANVAALPIRVIDRVGRTLSGSEAESALRQAGSPISKPGENKLKPPPETPKTPASSPYSGEREVDMRRFRAGKGGWEETTADGTRVRDESGTTSPTTFNAVVNSPIVKKLIPALHEVVEKARWSFVGLDLQKLADNVAAKMATADKPWQKVRAGMARFGGLTLHPEHGGYYENSPEFSGLGRRSNSIFFNAHELAADVVYKQQTDAAKPLNEAFAEKVGTVAIHELLHDKGLQHRNPGEQAQYTQLVEEHVSRLKKADIDGVLDAWTDIKNRITSRITSDDVAKLAKQDEGIKDDYLKNKRTKTTRSNTTPPEGKGRKEPTTGKDDGEVVPAGREATAKIAEKLLTDEPLAEPPSGEKPTKLPRISEEGFIQLPSRDELVAGLRAMVALPANALLHPIKTDRFLKGLYQSTLAGGLNTGERNALGTMLRFGAARTLDAAMLPFSRDAALRLAAAGKQLKQIPGNALDTAKMVKQGLLPDINFNLNNTRIQEARALESVLDAVGVPKTIKNQFLHLFASDIMTPGTWQQGTAPRLNMGDKWTRTMMAVNMTQERTMRLMVANTELSPLMRKLGVKNLVELDAKLAANPALAKASMRDVQAAITEALDMTAALRAPNKALEDITRGFSHIPLAWTVVPFFNYMVNNYAIQAIEMGGPLALISPRVRNSLNKNPFGDSHVSLGKKLGPIEQQIKALKARGVAKADPQLVALKKEAGEINSRMQDMEIRGLKSQTQVLRTASTGVYIAAVAAAITALTDDEKNEKKWYEVESVPKMFGAKAGSTIDVRPLFGPLGLYWYAGYRFARKTPPGKPSDKFYAGDTKEVLEALTNSRAKGAPGLGDVIDQFTADHLRQDTLQGKLSDVAFTYGKTAGKALTLAWVGEIARDLYAAYDPKAAEEKTWKASSKMPSQMKTPDAALQGIVSQIPGANRNITSKYSGTTGKPLKDEHPLMRLAIGPVHVPDKLSKFIDTHGIDKKAVYPKPTHYPEYDKRMYANWEKGANRDLPGKGSIMSWVDNKGIPEGTKVAIMEKRLAALRQEAHNAVIKEWAKGVQQSGKSPFGIPENELRKAVERAEGEIAKKGQKKWFTRLPGGVLGKQEGKINKYQRRKIDAALIARDPEMVKALAEMQRESLEPPPKE